jgi:hypothetical protein
VKNAFRDGIRGTLLMGLLGAVICLPLGFWEFADSPVWGRFLAAAIAGFLAGSAFGFTMWAGRSADRSPNGLAGEDARREEGAGYAGPRQTGDPFGS